MSLYETYLSKSKEYLINEIFNLWERNQKLQRQLEIQTKRVENLKKMFMYGNPESWIVRTRNEWIESSPRSKEDEELIRDYEHPGRDWRGTVIVGGKLARSCQAIDQELEKELENLK